MQGIFACEGSRHPKGSSGVCIEEAMEDCRESGNADSVAQICNPNFAIPLLLHAVSYMTAVACQAGLAEHLPLR